MKRNTKTMIIIAGIWAVIIVVTAGMVWQYTILGEVTLWTLGVLGGCIYAAYANRNRTSALSESSCFFGGVISTQLNHDKTVN